MMYTVEMASDSMIYVSICIKIALGSQVILSHYHDNLRGCSVGFTNGKDL
jgi:hypothetical protein